MKFSLSTLLLGAVGLTTTVLAGDFVANADEAFILAGVPGGAYYAAAPGGCAVKISDAGTGYLYDLSTKTSNNEIKDKGAGSAHVFNTQITTQDTGRVWLIDVANTLPYDWSTSYVYFLSGSRDGMDEYTLQKTKRVSPGGTLVCTCGDCKDDSAFGTNSVVATYDKEAVLVVPVAA